MPPVKGYAVGNVSPLGWQEGNEDAKGGEDHSEEHDPRHDLQVVDGLRPATHPGPPGGHSLCAPPGRGSWQEEPRDPGPERHLQDRTGHGRPWAPALVARGLWGRDPRPSIARGPGDITAVENSSWGGVAPRMRNEGHPPTPHHDRRAGSYQPLMAWGPLAAMSPGAGLRMHTPHQKTHGIQGTR